MRKAEEDALAVRGVVSMPMLRVAVPGTTRPASVGSRPRITATPRRNPGCLESPFHESVTVQII
ncbi:hypothetical protein BC827DRAFT_114307 [Russula dissimulans]|nr:hypothetical protein BC827DRAFT_114307 [Russula dissimulans]